MSGFSAEQIAVASDVYDIGKRYEEMTKVPPLMHLIITAQEDGWLFENPGDSGASHGPYQIYETAHPGVGAHISTDPGFDFGFWEIHERWAEQWPAVDYGWATGDRDTRIRIVQDFAPRAQGSIAWTLDEATERYDQAVAMLVLLN